ncbi:MAG: peptide deformylase [Bacteroidales bacterium]|nr:peptide deformylase [Bacteroidales bacterium]
MILPIYTYGHRLLRKKAVDIEKDYPNLKNIIENMFETLYSAEGVGLAAPQVGLSIRLFIVDATSMKKEHPELSNFKKIFINARILKEEGAEWYYNEGCLSIPGIREDVLRKSIVTIEYYDENFLKHTETYNGIAARIIQHEYDHIEGILFIDRLSSLRKTLLKSRLNMIAKGRIQPKYKIVAP